MKNKSLFIRRIIYILLFVLSLTFISFRGGNLPYMLFFMMVINTVFSIVYILYVFFTLKIYQSVPERRVTKKDTVSYRLQLSNESRFAYRSVKLVFMERLSTVKAAAKFDSVSLKPGQGISVDTELFCHYAGTYYIGVDTIEIMDYFRIFRIRFHMPQKLKLTVRPRILRTDNIAFITQEEECRDSGQKGKSEYRVDNEVRKYVPGDNKRMIHWKNSAKRRELMVRNLTAEEITEYVVILDEWAGNGDAAEQIICCDKLRELMTALVYYIFDSGYHVLSVMGHSFREEIHSQREFDAFYNKIIDFGFGKSAGFDELLLELNRELQEGIPFIMVSQAPDAISDETRKMIKDFRNFYMIDVNRFHDIEEFLEVTK